MSIHVISGPPRTGTSMLMRIMDKASSLTAVYDSTMDDQYNEMAVDGYEPNPNGYYSIKFQDLMTYDFNDLDGHVVKVEPRNLYKLPREFQYKVLFTTRNVEAIRASFYQAFGFDTSYYTAMSGEREYENRYNTLLIKDDLDALLVEYESLMSDPESGLQRIIDNGWPLRETAINYVDLELFRIR